MLEPVRDPETGHAISPVIAAALCIKPRGKLSSDQARKVEALMEGSPVFTTMRHLAMRFNGIMRGRKADPLPAWIDDAIETDLAPIVRFARTLNSGELSLKVDGAVKSRFILGAGPPILGHDYIARQKDR